VKNIKKFSMQPSALRLLLTLSLFIVAGLAITGFVLVQQKLSAYAVEVSHKKVDAAGSKASLQTLQSIEKELAANSETVIKAKNIKHTSDLPQFKAIEDINNHAKANSLTISNVTFASVDASTAAGSTPAPGAAATPVATTQADGVDITFTLSDGIEEGTIDTLNFVHFMYDIEHSTPKMQIQGIGVTGKSSSRLTVEPITIKMFTKKPEQG
jgi:hypothetical protein